MRKQEENICKKKQKQTERARNQGPPDIPAQLGPPDCVTNFTGSSTHSNSVLGKRNRNKSEEIEFKPNTRPDALGKKVKMKFETSAEEQWLME